MSSEVISKKQTEDVAAIQEALEHLASGDKGMLFEDFDREFRERHHLPGKDDSNLSPRRTEPGLRGPYPKGVTEG